MNAMAQNGAGRAIFVFTIMAALLVMVGFLQSWSVALTIINLCIISAIMTLGVNIQWGYAGLFNVGTMGFAALGGVAAVLVSKAPVGEAWAVGGVNLFYSLLMFVLTIAVVIFVRRKMAAGRLRLLAMFIVGLSGYFLIRIFYDPAVNAIEAVDSARFGYLGGMGLPVLLSWPVGGLFAAGAAWIVGKVALGLRSDYLAIATLGISEIIVAGLKNEDWLTRGVKNVTGLPRPVPYEIDLQVSPKFIEWVEWFNASALSSLADAEKASALQKMIIQASTLFVKLSYAGLFSIVLIFILTLSVLALNSPWGRMMRAIRDNEVSSAAMGKDVNKRRLEIFIVGSIIMGIGGAALATSVRIFDPSGFLPLNHTFLIWVMVIMGGSGNNLGVIFGSIFVYIIYTVSEPATLIVFEALQTYGKLWFDWDAPGDLMSRALQMRVFIIGLTITLVLRYAPKGVLPEKVAQHG